MLDGKRILVTQPLICSFNGSTLVTLELALELQRLGAKVTVYTCSYENPAKAHFQKKGIKVDTAQDNPTYKLNDFDYVWVHSQILPLSLLNALSHKTKKVPKFVFLHMSGMDWIPDEKPWIYELENHLSSLSVFISEEVEEVNKPFLNPKIATTFFRNPVPSIYKNRKNKPQNELKNLLIVSNHPPIEVMEAKKILTDKYKINVDVLGEKQQEYTIFNKAILEKYDAVLTIAKTVPYCLVSGTPVYVYDAWGGGPGWLNENNFTQAKTRNFSGYQNDQYPNYEGGVFHQKTAAEIAEEIVSGYHESLAFHKKQQQSFINEFTIDAALPKIFAKIKAREIAPLSKKYVAAAIAAERFAIIKFEITGLLTIRDTHIENLERERAKLLSKMADYDELAEYKREAEKVFESGAYQLFEKLIVPYKKIRGK